MRARKLMGLAAALLMAATALGQTAKSFDVATVKPSAPLDIAKLRADAQAGHVPNFGAHLDGRRAEYNYMSLHDLVAYAYGVQPYRVVAPDWMTTARFDIVARLPEGSSTDDAPAMLQTLLKDRFGLQAHLEDKDQPVYALVVGKDGPKLKDSPEQPAIDPAAPLKPGERKQDLPDGPAIISGNPAGGQATVNMGTRGVFLERIDMQALDLEGKGVTMAGFANLLNQISQIGGPGARLIVDQTGLKGHYEVALQLSLTDLIAAMRRAGVDIPNGPSPGGGGAPASAPEASDPGGGSGQSVFSAVEKLGLRLESTKAPVQQLIVDHAEKTPTEN